MNTLRVLMVEDSADDAELAARTLRGAGYELTFRRVDTPQTMRAALAKPEWDLALVDISLPHFDGLEALAMLRARDPDFAMIVVSGTVDEEFAIKAMKAGANDLVLKNNLARLRSAVERELREAEVRRARRRAESQYRNLFNSVPVGVLIVTREGKALEANAALLRMMGIKRRALPESALGETAGRQPPEAALALDFRKFVRPDDQQRFDALLGQAGRIRAEEGFELVGADARQIAVRLSVGLMDANQSAKIGVVVTDVSELKRAEEVAIAARDAALGLARLRYELLAIASHEIQPPLNSIVGLIESVLASSMTDEQRGELEAVGITAHSLLEIVNNILDFSRIASWKLVLENANFDIAQVFENVIDQADVLARQKELELQLAIEDSVPPRLYGDPLRLQQVLTILVRNAIKFTEHGSVAIRVARQSSNDSTVTLRCEVKDTGIGIASERQRTLFEPFARVESSVGQGGPGLGLAIASGLVTLMGGEIGIESELGAGSTFWFTVKLGITPSTAQIIEARPPLPRPAEPKDRALQSPVTTRGVRILLAEDGAANRFLVLRLLDQLGCLVQSVANGQQALEAASKNPYDVILMDCRMPIMDGYEATRSIRQQEGTARHTRIVAMIAQALSGDREKCLAAGMDDCISKPVTLENLGAALQRVLSIDYGARPAAPGTDNKPPATAQAPVLDPATMTSLRAQGDLLPGLIETVLNEMPEQLKRISAALATRDHSDAAIAAHSLKGTALIFGATRMAELAKAVEHAAEANAAEQAAAELDRLERECGRVSRQLEGERGQLAGKAH